MSPPSPPSSPPPTPDPEREIDRAAILARRAMFITTALAALGCTPQGTGPQTPPATPAVSSAAQPPAPNATPTPPPSDPPPTNPPAAPRSFADIERLAPPRTASAKLPADEKAELDELAETLAPAYERLARAYESTPIACSPDDPKCEPTWARVVDDLRVVRDAIEDPLCGMGGSAGKLQRFTQHQAFLSQQATAIEAELAAAARRWRAEGKWAAWTEIISPPQPCLKCAPPTPRVVSAPRGHDFPLAIGFAAGDRDTPDPDALKTLKAALDEAPTLKVILRGHADPAEKDADALALARAKAVQRRLVEQGISAARLKTQSLGAELPIGPLATPEGQALNRRVDVHLVGG